MLSEKHRRDHVNTRDKLLRDIDTIRTSINTNWQDLAALNLSSSDRRKIRHHIKWCVLQLNMLLLQLEHEEADDDA